MNATTRLWTSRGLIGLVLFANVQCALAFLAAPARYAPAYELAGAVGAAAIQGYAVLFLMWNVPYLIGFANPVRYRVSLLEAVAMQALGVIGESYIWVQLPAQFPTLRASILRFILFDAAGLLALLLAAWITRPKTKNIEAN